MNSDFAIGQYWNKMENYLSKSKMSEDWQICLLKTESNPTFTLKILPREFLKNLTKKELEYYIKSPIKQTSFVYRCKSGAILMRRGIVSNIEGDGYERDLEDKLAKIIAKTAYKNEYKSIMDKKIRHYFFVPLFKNQKAYIKNNDVIYQECPWKNALLKVKMGTNRIGDRRFNYLFMSEIENEPLNIVLRIALDISKQLMNNETILIEDTEELTISHICCSLVKILCDVKYRKIKGYISLIKEDWMNFCYNFWEKSHRKHNKLEINNIPYRMLHLSVFYLLRMNPEYFEFNSKFLNEIESIIMPDRQSPYKNPWRADPLRDILLRTEPYKNLNFKKNSSMFELFSKTQPGENAANGTPDIYDKEAYAKFWTNFNTLYEN